MKLREFLNTCTNDLERYCIYFDQENWDELTPDIEAFDMRDLSNAIVSTNRVVDAWFIDANWSLHVLVSWYGG